MCWCACLYICVNGKQIKNIANKTEFIFIRKEVTELRFPIFECAMLNVIILYFFMKYNPGILRYLASEK